MNPLIGILGGSGLYSMEGLTVAERRTLETPFGAPSGPLVLGTLAGTPVVFLARHGEGHRLLPSEINYRANIWALKAAGVQSLISVSAVGSLQEAHPPATLRLPSQFIDRTHLRASTFFGDGLVAHVGFSDPVCPCLGRTLLEVGRELGLPLETCGSYVCMEGPAFSTRAESLLHRSWGADLIGMTQATEAKLAREAEICFATVALVTDFDAWRVDAEGVETHDIMAVMHANLATVAVLIRAALGRIDPAPGCRCRTALATAIMTRPESIPAATRQKLELFLKN
jgi:5'-methylthioadenosine phosphorylase